MWRRRWASSLCRRAPLAPCSVSDALTHEAGNDRLHTKWGSSPARECARAHLPRCAPLQEALEHARRTHCAHCAARSFTRTHSLLAWV